MSTKLYKLIISRRHVQWNSAKVGAKTKRNRGGCVHKKTNFHLSQPIFKYLKPLRFWGLSASPQAKRSLISRPRQPGFRPNGKWFFQRRILRILCAFNELLEQINDVISGCEMWYKRPKEWVQDIMVPTGQKLSILTIADIFVIVSGI